MGYADQCAAQERAAEAVRLVPILNTEIQALRKKLADVEFALAARPLYSERRLEEKLQEAVSIIDNLEAAHDLVTDERNGYQLRNEELRIDIQNLKFKADRYDMLQGSITKIHGWANFKNFILNQSF